MTIGVGEDGVKSEHMSSSLCGLVASGYFIQVCFHQAPWQFALLSVPVLVAMALLSCVTASMLEH